MRRYCLLILSSVAALSVTFPSLARAETTGRLTATLDEQHFGWVTLDYSVTADPAGNPGQAVTDVSIYGLMSPITSPEEGDVPEGDDLVRDLARVGSPLAEAGTLDSLSGRPCRTEVVDNACPSEGETGYHGTPDQVDWHVIWLCGSRSRDSHRVRQENGEWVSRNVACSQNPDDGGRAIFIRPNRVGRFRYYLVIGRRNGVPKVVASSEISILPPRIGNIRGDFLNDPPRVSLTIPHPPGATEVVVSGGGCSGRWDPRSGGTERTVECPVGVGLERGLTLPGYIRQDFQIEAKGMAGSSDIRYVTLTLRPVEFSITADFLAAGASGVSRQALRLKKSSKKRKGLVGRVFEQVQSFLTSETSSVGMEGPGIAKIYPTVTRWAVLSGLEAREPQGEGPASDGEAPQLYYMVMQQGQRPRREQPPPADSADSISRQVPWVKAIRFTAGPEPSFGADRQTAFDWIPVRSPADIGPKELKRNYRCWRYGAEVEDFDGTKIGSSPTKIEKNYEESWGIQFQEDISGVSGAEMCQYTKVRCVSGGIGRFVVSVLDAVGLHPRKGICTGGNFEKMNLQFLWEARHVEGVQGACGNPIDAEAFPTDPLNSASYQKKRGRVSFESTARRPVDCWMDVLLRREIPESRRARNEPAYGVVRRRVKHLRIECAPDVWGATRIEHLVD